MPARTHQEGMDTVLQFKIDLTSREMRWIYLALWKQYVSTFPGWLFRNNWVKPLEEKGGAHLKSWGGQSPKESMSQRCSTQCGNARSLDHAAAVARVARASFCRTLWRLHPDYIWLSDYTLEIRQARFFLLHPRPSKTWQLGACSSKAFSLENITCLEPTTHTEIWTDLIHLKFNQRKWAIFFTRAHSWNPKKWFFSSVQSPCFSGKFGIVPSIWGNIIIHEWGFLSTKLYKNKMTGWWLGILLFSIIYGMSSFPLTFTFFKMVKTTNQKWYWSG